MIRGFDASAWQGTLTRQDFDYLNQTYGMELFVCQLHGGGPDGSNPYRNPYAPGNLNAALEAGWGVAGYCWPSWSWPAALDGIGLELERKLWFLSLDVEAGAGAHVDQIKDLRDRGVVPCVYTSIYEWERIMPGRTDFADVLLWDASWFGGYDQINWPNYLAEHWVGYGGWPLRRGWQFNSLGVSTPSGMKTLDLNLFADDVVPVPLPPPDPLEELKNRMAAAEEQLRSIGTELDTIHQAVVQLTSVSGDLMRRVFQMEGWQGVVKIAAHEIQKER